MKNTKKYKNKYRIKSARLPNWNYGWNSAYFITICTKNRKHYFGKIVETQNIASLPNITPNMNMQNFAHLPYEMQLSEIGKLAKKYWYEIPQHFTFVKLGTFIVMPNHVHGIIIIDKTDGDATSDGAMVTVETQNIASLQSQTYKNKFGPQSKNMASIVRGYKIGVTKNARLINPEFAWQSRFYDHIIRNEKSFNKISEYIINNPINWDKDELNEML